MAQNKMQMPGVFGGLMRYDDEYNSRFVVTPTQVIGFVIAVIILVLLLKIFFPLSLPATPTGGSTPLPIPGGFILPLLGF